MHVLGLDDGKNLAAQLLPLQGVYKSRGSEKCTASASLAPAANA